MAHHDDNPWSKEAESNASRPKSDIVNMKWSPGEHTIRVCPATKKGSLPFVKYIAHWVPVTNSTKDRPIVHSTEFRCPVCKFVSKLWGEINRLKEEDEMTENSPEVKKLQKQISKLRGKKTYDMNIIDRKDCHNEDGSIKIKRLVAGPTIWKPIIELGNSEKWGNPSSAGARGYDLTITVDGEKLKREYTILPDPDRRPLTEEEIKAVEEKGYNLAALRKFSTTENILDVLENAKAPLDSLNLAKIAKELESDKKAKDDDVDAEETSSSKDDDDDDKDTEDVEVKQTRSSKPKVDDDDDEDDDKPQPKKPTKLNDDEDDEDDDKPQAKKPTKSDDEDDEDEDEVIKNKQNAKDDKKEEKAFGKDDDDDDDDDDVKSEKPAKVKMFTYDVSDISLDCRGTYDKHDVGCQECKTGDECKQLKKEFKAKAEELGVDISEKLGSEIEKILEKASKPVAAATGKVGKQGSSAPAAEGGKRKLPF